MTVTPSSSPVMRRFLITVTRAKTLQDSWDSNNLQPHDRWCEEPGEDPMAGRIELTPMGTGVTRCDDVYFQDLIQPCARSQNIGWCPEVPPSFVWKKPGFKSPISENRTSYWYNWYYWNGDRLAKVNEVAASPVVDDMPYGPDYVDLPHPNGLNVVYADGHAKFFRDSDRELPARKGGNWWDLVHQGDGQ